MYLQLRLCLGHHPTLSITPSLGRESDVCPSQYPCYEFLHAADIYGEVTNLITSAGLSKIVLEERPQYVKLTNMFVQSFNFIDDQYHPRVEFML